MKEAAIPYVNLELERDVRVVRRDREGEELRGRFGFRGRTGGWERGSRIEKCRGLAGMETEDVCIMLLLRLRTARCRRPVLHAVTATLATGGIVVAISIVSREDAKWKKKKSRANAKPEGSQDGRKTNE